MSAGVIRPALLLAFLMIQGQRCYSEQGKTSAVSRVDTREVTIASPYLPDSLPESPLSNLLAVGLKGDPQKRSEASNQR